MWFYVVAVVMCDLGISACYPFSYQVRLKLNKWRLAFTRTDRLTHLNRVNTLASNCNCKNYHKLLVHAIYSLYTFKKN